METNNFNFKNGMSIDKGLLSGAYDRGAVEVSAVLCDKTVSADVGGDFVIPEHLPELHRLIKVDARPSTPSKFLSGGGVQISGGVEYTAIYAATDGEIYSVSFPGDYNVSVPFDEGADRGDVDRISAWARVIPESAVSRAGGGGHLNVRCRLSVKVLAVGKKAPMGGVGGEFPDSVQRLVKKCAVACELRGVKDDAELISSVDTRGGDVRYLSSDCSVFVTDTLCGDGYVDCRGYASVKHLVYRDGELASLSERIPFSETVEIDGAESGMSAFVCGVCSDIVRRSDVSGEEILDDGGSVGLTLRLCFDAAVLKSGSLEYIKDAYSTASELKLETKKLCLPTPLICKNGNMTFSGRAPAPEMGIVEGMRVADCYGSARVDSVEFTSGAFVALGRCRFSILTLSESGETALAECELPFKYEFEGNEGKARRLDCSASVIEPRATVEGGEAVFDCELAISVFAMGEKEIEAMISAADEGSVPERRSGLTVCYPDSGDSLWSVAKRYRSPLIKTATENGMDGSLDADELRLPEGRKYMIV